MNRADAIPPERGIFANRTINLRSIRAIGYDMDYTLLHYRVKEWETVAFEHAKARLLADGWPVSEVTFDPDTVIRGLAIDLAEGNLLKATRFGWVIRAAHGTGFLDFDTVRRTYAGTVVDLADDRFEFLNTLFSLSEASLYAQLVDLMDAGVVAPGIGYHGLYGAVREALDTVHADGELKQEIVADPERFVEPDPDIVPTLLDQHNAGKKLMLITNAEWDYTQVMMAYAMDPFLPDGMGWRDLFDTIIVSADKPGFFTSTRPLYRVVDEAASLLLPHPGPIEAGAVFFGGCARHVETSLDLAGDEILYVGDHIFGDVHYSKALLRWRTALILRELESEMRALIEFQPQEAELTMLMQRKVELESRLAALRLAEQRMRLGYAAPPLDVRRPRSEIERVRSEIGELDELIMPLAIAAGRLRNETWGPLMRAGVDKSLFARQVERYADCYTSRVSNLLHATPFALMRARRTDLPHDPDARVTEADA
jgi:5'-nucleotidase